MLLGLEGRGMGRGMYVGCVRGGVVGGDWVVMHCGAALRIAAMEGK
jgi:hydrogenase maturation factor